MTDVAKLYVQAIRNVCLATKNRSLDAVAIGYAIQEEYERLASQPTGDADAVQLEAAPLADAPSAAQLGGK